ncbi:MAG: hypothetical protein IJV31_05245 [Clostridia bacterium]|nr:hypothetical protein [Clostridia bacterium]
MKKILMKFDVVDRHYCIYIETKTNQVNAIAIKKNFETYRVTKEKELEFLNKIIRDNLSKKYFKEEEIEFQRESYIRYINRYDKKNYFAKQSENNLKVISYDENPELYNMYNPTTIINYKIKSNNQNHARVTASSFGGKMKIVGATAIGAVIITITGCGREKLANSEPPVVTAVEQESVFQQENDIGETIEFDESVQSTELISEQIIEIDELKGYQLNPINEEQIKLKEKYDTVKTALEELGLENWEISIELNDVKNMNAIVFDETPDDINFYYDSESNSVIYIYGDYDRKVNTYDEQEVEESTCDVIPENVQKIIDKINANPNLTDEEKEFIIDVSRDDLIKNSEDLLTNVLLTRFGNLCINYDTNKFQVELVGSPYNQAAAYYQYDYIPTSEEVLEQGGWEKFLADRKSEICIGNATSFDNAEKSTLKHEIGHIRGEFGTGNTLLNEGYNSWNTGDDVYKNEEAMAMLMISAFGKDVMDKGYYTMDLTTAIANEIARRTGKNANETYEESCELLSAIQTVLYKMGEKKTEYYLDKEIMKDLQDVIKQIEALSENDKGNVTMVLEDYLLKTNQSGILNEGEKIDTAKLEKTGEKVEVTIIDEKGMIEFENPNAGLEDYGMMHQSSGRYSRKVQVINKGTTHENIKDEDLEYHNW